MQDLTPSPHDPVAPSTGLFEMVLPIGLRSPRPSTRVHGARSDISMPAFGRLGRQVVGRVTTRRRPWRLSSRTTGLSGQARLADQPPASDQKSPSTFARMIRTGPQSQDPGALPLQKGTKDQRVVNSRASQTTACAVPATIRLKSGCRRSTRTLPFLRAATEGTTSTAVLNPCRAAD
jgi:hypothetical protein